MSSTEKVEAILFWNDVAVKFKDMVESDEQRTNDHDDRNGNQGLVDHAEFSPSDNYTATPGDQGLATNHTQNLADSRITISQSLPNDDLLQEASIPLNLFDQTGQVDLLNITTTEDQDIMTSTITGIYSDTNEVSNSLSEHTDATKVATPSQAIDQLNLGIADGENEQNLDISTHVNRTYVPTGSTITPHHVSGGLLQHGEVISSSSCLSTLRSDCYPLSTSLRNIPSCLMNQPHGEELVDREESVIDRNTIKLPAPTYSSHLNTKGSNKVESLIASQSNRDNNSCPHCGKSGFSSKGNLKRHINGHTSKKGWKCDVCESSFTEKKSLYIHYRKHTGEKPYPCNLCDKFFSQKAVLDVHMAGHLGMRKFKCPRCPKSFSQKNHLTVHLKRHDGSRDKECPKCSVRFITKAELDRHLRTHSGERPHTCGHCGSKFARLYSYYDHVKRHLGHESSVLRSILS